jgi:hypothetical protein
MQDGQNDLVHRTLQRACQRREPGKMRRVIELLGENDWVVTPDGDTTAKAAAQLAQLGNGVICWSGRPPTASSVPE